MINLEKRHLLIIRHLINSRKPLSSEVLSSVLGFSSKTIREDMRFLEEVLRNVGAEVITKSGTGYSIQIHNAYEFDIFLQFFNDKYWDQTTVHGSVMMKHLIYRMLFSKDVALSDLTNDLCLNERMLQKQIVLCRQFLEEYHLGIKRKNGRVQIIGKEEHLRILMGEMMFMDEDSTVSSQDSCIFLPLLDSRRCLNVLKDELAAHHIRISKQSAHLIRSQLMVSATRIKDGHPVHFHEVECKDIQQYEEYECAKRIVQQLYPASPDAEIAYLTLLLVSSRNYDIHDDFSLSENSSAYFLGDEMLKFLFIHTNKDFSKYYDVRLYLARELRGMIVRLIYGLEYKQIPMLRVKQNCIAYEYAVIMSDYLSKKYACPISQKEIAVLSNILNLSLIRNQREENRNRKKIVIIFQNGMNDSLPLKEKINQRFAPYLERVESLEYYEYDRREKQEDLIITDMPISSFPHSKRVLQVKNGFDREEQNRMFAWLTDIDEKHRIFMSAFSSDLVYLDQPCADSQTALKTLCRNMQKDPAVSEHLYEMAVTHDRVSGSEKGNNIAIAHSMFAAQKMTKIGIMVLRKPILWKDELVRLLFVIANGEQQESFFHLEELQELLQDLEVIHEILNTNSPDEVLHILDEHHRDLKNGELSPN